MSDNLKFLIQICGITSLILLAIVLLVNYLADGTAVRGIVYGYLLSLANILFAFFSMKWAFSKSNKTFFTVVLGGMGVRFGVLLTVLLVVWKFTQIPLLGFILSLVGFYLTLQIFEIRFIQKHLNGRKVTN